MIRDPPRFEPLLLHCNRCFAQSDDWQPANAPVETWVAHIRTLRCPRCGAGSDHLAIRQAAASPAAPSTPPDPARS